MKLGKVIYSGKVAAYFLLLLFSPPFRYRTKEDMKQLEQLYIDGELTLFGLEFEQPSASIDLTGEESGRDSQSVYKKKNQLHACVRAKFTDCIFSYSHVNVNSDYYHYVLTKIIMVHQTIQLVMCTWL